MTNAATPAPVGKSATERVGRRLAYVLRHDPASIGLVPDAAGWVAVEDLVAGLRRSGVRADRAAIESVVAADGKSRYTLSPDKARIRAAQGHSYEVDLGLEPVAPPAVLYHGTARATLDAIFASGGLEPRTRRQVHLSADVETATRVGARHGKPVVLAIDAAAMHAAGTPFFRADNGVWLVDAVPARHIGYADPAETPAPSAGGRPSGP